MYKNFKNTKSFLSSYNIIYSVEIINDKMVVSESWNILADIEINIENPILFKNRLYADPYKLLDNLNSVRALFTVFKRRNIFLSPKVGKNEIK